jgi:hypothetical protein
MAGGADHPHRTTVSTPLSRLGTGRPAAEIVYRRGMPPNVGGGGGGGGGGGFSAGRELRGATGAVAAGNNTDAGSDSVSLIYSGEYTPSVRRSGARSASALRPPTGSVRGTPNQVSETAWARLGLRRGLR